MTDATLLNVREAESADGLRSAAHTAASKILVAFLVVIGILQVLNFLFFTTSSLTHAVSLITHG